MKRKTPKVVDISHVESAVTVKNRPDKNARVRALNAPDYFNEAIQKERAGFKTFGEIVGNPKVTMLHESMLSDSPKQWPVITDPESKLKVHARIVRVKWLESNKKETRQVVYSPSEFKEAFKKASKQLREASKKKNLTESQKNELEKLSEDMSQTFDGTWPSLPINAQTDNMFLPMPPGDLTKQIYLNDQWEMMAQAHQLYSYNATAHGGVNILAAFVAGDGAGAQSEDDKVQEVLDEFVERIKFKTSLFVNCIMLSKNGELLWHLPEIMVEGKPGYTDFISKDPGNCWEIITEPADVRHVKGYYFNYPTRYMIYTEDKTPTADYIVEVIPPAEMVHTKINVEQNEARGRSDLLSIMPLLKLIYDNLRYRNIKVMNSAGILIDRTILGDTTDVTNVAAIQTGFTGAGTEYTHNESEKITVLKGAESENAKSGLHEETMGQAGTGLGVSGDYLGAGGTGSRASALTRTEPAAKLFLARQILLEASLKDVFRKVIENAKKYNRLPKDAPEEVEITFPEVAPDNQKDKIGILNIGLQTRAISHEEYVSAYRTELKINKSYEYDELQQKINEEKQGQLAALYQSPMVDPETGMVTDKPLGGGGGGSSQNPNAQGKNQSKKAYDGKNMGMSSSTRNNIKKQLQAVRGGGVGKHSAHGHIHKGLRSRTKHTHLHQAEENAFGPLLRVGTRDITMDDVNKEVESMKKSGAWEDLMGMASEVTPPGFPDDVKAKIKAQYPGDDATAFSTMWMLRGNGWA